MGKKIVAILLLLTVVAGSAEAQRGKRAIKRIDREVQETVFIPKGTWMFGGTISYSEHDESNLNFLILQDLEGKGYDFSISPYFGYFIRNNIAVGGRFTYSRDYLDLGSADVDLGDITLSFRDLYYLEHKYEASGFIRTYIPIGRSKIFGLFNEARLTYSYGQGKNSTRSGVDYTGTYQTVQGFQIGVAPGLTAFITDWSAVEVSVGVMGFDFKWIDQQTNQVEEGSMRTTSGNFKINLFSINIGMTFYI